MSASESSEPPALGFFAGLSLVAFLVSFFGASFYLFIYLIVIIVTNVTSPYVLSVFALVPFIILSFYAPEKTVAFAGVASLAFFIASYIATITAPMDRNLEQTKAEIMTKTWPLTLVAIIGIGITSALYLTKDPSKMIYILLAFACLSLGMSYGSTVISLLNA